MPRYVVYQPAPPAPAVADQVKEPTADDYASKLVKYIPAEVTAFFVVGAAIGHTNQTWLIVAVVLGIIGTPAYLVVQSVNADPKPLLHFYVLAAIAFIPWALAVSPDLASLLGVPALAASFLLATGIFVIPLADDLMTAAAKGQLKGMFREKPA